MQILEEESLCHAPTNMLARPVALAGGTQEAFLRGDCAVGNAVGLGAEAASVGEVDRATLEVFLGVALVGVHSVRID